MKRFPLCETIQLHGISKIFFYFFKIYKIAKLFLFFLLKCSFFLLYLIENQYSDRLYLKMHLKEHNWMI